jgi:hypothetical protein
MRRQHTGNILLLLATAGAGCVVGYDPQIEFWPPPLDAGSRLGAGGSQAFGGGGSRSDNATGGNEGTGGSQNVIGSSGAGGSQGMAGSSGEGGRSGAGGSQGTVDAGAPPPTNSCMKVVVTTATDNGRYSPRNVGAIWIAGSSGNFIKTLALWGSRRINNLTAWNSATSQAGLGGNTVDAVTGATMSSHQTHTVTWTCTDTKEKIVPDGPYGVYFEMTDQNGTGPSTSVQFTKGTMPLALSPADKPNFKGLSVVFSP